MELYSTLDRYLLRVLYQQALNTEHPTLTISDLIEKTKLNMGPVLMSLKKLMNKELISEKKNSYELVADKKSEIKKLLQQSIIKKKEASEIVETALKCLENSNATVDTSREDNPSDGSSQDPNCYFNLERVHLSDFDFKLMNHHLKEIKHIITHSKNRNDQKQQSSQFNLLKGHFVFWGIYSCEQYWQQLTKKYQLN